MDNPKGGQDPRGQRSGTHEDGSLLQGPGRCDTLVVRWVDRLGRNYADVTDTIREFIRRGAIVRTVINGLTFDGATKDAMQQAVRDSPIAFMAAMAQALAGSHQGSAESRDRACPGT